MTPQERYHYYRLLSEELGVDHKELEKPGADPAKVGQENYSVAWYYACNSYGDLPDLVKAILGDEQAELRLDWNQPAVSIDDGLFEGNTLNDSQKEAIRAALIKPVSLIQGPPGTGKTYTIINMMSVMSKMGFKVAVISSNNKAIADIGEKIEELPLPPGSAGSNVERLKNGTVRLGGAGIRSQVNKPGFSFKASKKLSSRKYATETYGGGMFKRENEISAATFLAQYPCILSTIHSLQNCFSDGGTFQYDYVIMDESSQTPIHLGLLAAHAAKHLVLVGDDEQLPPVVSEDYMAELQRKHRGYNAHTLSDFFQDTENSFLTLCTKRFAGKDNYVFLDRHYRCHPGIIGFCRDLVYGSRLRICTTGYDTSVALPINITWYEGSYSQSYVIKASKGEKERKSRVNSRQIRIFMNEKYLDVVRYIQNEDKSVAVLSPYRGQLYELKKVIDKYNRKAGITGIHVELNGGEQNNGGEDDDTLDVLTIHKSQGAEFDIIYLMTVDDDAVSRKFDFPWTQKRRLINVAASRAKQELHIITSTNLMSTKVQHRLVKYVINSGHRTSGKDYFVEKLIDYAYSYYAKTPHLFEGVFGFFKARTYSVYDKKTYQLKIDGVDLGSSYEDCMAEALLGSKLIKSYHLQVGHEYSMAELIAGDPTAKAAYGTCDTETQTFLMQQGTHMDFPVTDEKGALLAVIEVDGEYHKDEEQKRRDEMKDAFLEGKLGIPVLRMTVDGNPYCDPGAPLDIVSDELNEMDHIEGKLLSRIHAISTSKKVVIKNMAPIPGMR